MNTARTLMQDFGGPKMEGELAAICEILVLAERCAETVNYWGHRWFKFEDGSSIVFGMIGPLARDAA